MGGRDEHRLTGRWTKLNVKVGRFILLCIDHSSSVLPVTAPCSYLMYSQKPGRTVLTFLHFCTY